MAMSVLICVEGERMVEFLAAVQQRLAPDLAWLLLHVTDTRPLAEAERALGGLIGREPARQRAEQQLEDLTAHAAASVQTAIAAWLSATGQSGEGITAHGRPEREIMRVAEERAVDLIVLGRGRGHDANGRYPGPGDFPLSPVARFVTDHAHCNVLLLSTASTASTARGL